MTNVTAIIPARYESTRFPGKPLVNLLGKPMILWVAEISSRAVGIENVYVATDDNRIADVVRMSGFGVVMTRHDVPTGTDRVAEAANQIRSDIYLNIQGDEPLLDPNDILNIIQNKKMHPRDVINGFCPIRSEDDVNSHNVPKVVFTNDNRLIYASRLPIPGSKKNKKSAVHFKQVCIYAFNNNQLLKFQKFGKRSDIETVEDIEILRFFELGETIRMVQTADNSFAVDVPKDVSVVENEMMKRRYKENILK